MEVTLPSQMARSMAASVSLGLPVVECDPLRHIIKSSPKQLNLSIVLLTWVKVNNAVCTPMAIH